MFMTHISIMIWFHIDVLMYRYINIETYRGNIDAWINRYKDVKICRYIDIGTYRKRYRQMSKTCSKSLFMCMYIYICIFKEGHGHFM